MSGETVTIHNTTRNAVLGDRIKVAETSLSRIVGLLGQTGSGTRYWLAYFSLPGNPYGGHAVRD